MTREENKAALSAAQRLLDFALTDQEMRKMTHLQIQVAFKFANGAIFDHMRSVTSSIRIEDTLAFGKPTVKIPSD